MADLPLLAGKIREARGSLSQEDFAGRVTAFLPPGYKATRFDVIRWERGDEPRPLLLKLRAIAVASGTTVESFLDDGVPPAEAAMRAAAEGLVVALLDAVRAASEEKEPVP